MSKSLPLLIERYVASKPKANKLSLPLDRSLGELCRYKYVYAEALPLRLDRKIKNQAEASHLSLSMTNPKGVLAPSLYFYAVSLPLPLSEAILDQPPSYSLPFSLSRNLGELKPVLVEKIEAQSIAVEGFNSEKLADPKVMLSQAVIAPVGIMSLETGAPQVVSQPKEGYVTSLNLIMALAGDVLNRPDATSLPLPMLRQHGQFLNRPVINPNNKKYLYPKTFLSSIVSNKPSALLYYQYVTQNGIDSFKAGATEVRNSQGYINPQSWSSSVVGSASDIVNRNYKIEADGFKSSAFGSSNTYNLKQLVRLFSEDHSLYGTAYLLGGVKYLDHYGHNSNVFGSLVLTNTTANQEVTPAGIDSLSTPAPTVSPRILYATGINSLVVGVPEVRDPSLKPMGENHTTYGSPTIWFHTRPLTPAAILAYESGYLRIADPTQFVLAPALIESAIFGDTAIRNLSFKVGVKGVDESSFSDYSTLTNSNRYYAPKGVSSLSVGAATIYNKTPSVFVSSIAPYDAGVPAIGHAIRFVQTSGFDRLLFGLPMVIKAPELLVSGHQDSTVSSPTVWYKNRTIDLNARGIDSFRAYNQTVWFGLRPIATYGWESSSHARPQLTHGVRTVETQGFKVDDIGYAWVSQGTRAIEPEGIYKNFPTNVLVGGTQTVKPAGYEATLWGERIIPISRSIQPLGFREVWGNATASLFTKYIAPAGYISVGQQPADRWGDITVYNKLQYIVQNFDINNGLAPPKWPDYMLIENRNKTIGVTSFVAAKFGYSQIDNNATPLLPVAISPPPITIGMISHGIRRVSPEAIENPPMLDWSVIYNAARVIAPPAVVNISVGQPVVANTRRYYSGVGRFESLETGTPMIAYRIRTIDIEPRYSIAPPQINLPIIDLHTRYVGFNGYEAVKYGMPSLSIHFNIIGPSWDHREKFGESVVRNVTPELQVGAFDSQEFGNAGIRMQWRYVQAQGDNANLFGLTTIADTKRSVTVRGWQDTRISQQHVLTQLGTNPYVIQKIFLNNEASPDDDGYGIFDPRLVGNPLINQNVLYPNGKLSSSFGVAFVYSNNIKIDVGIAIDNVSSGLTVFNLIQSVVIGSSQSIDSSIVVGTPRMSPHTIWAPAEAPEQAKANHGNKPVEYIGWESPSKPELRLGRPFVESTIRSIKTVGSDSLDFSKSGPSVALSNRYITLFGIRDIGVGTPEIPFTTKRIEVSGFNSNNTGLAKVAPPDYVGVQYIQPTGNMSLQIGRNSIDNFIRRIYPIGPECSLLGQSKDGDTPYLWQGLRVGEFVPMSIGAGDTSSFGQLEISLKVREIGLDGFVAFRSEYELIKFKDRMKVIGSITDNTKSQGITAGGISSQAMGSTGIKLGQHFIRPDGNSDQFRKGAF